MRIKTTINVNTQLFYRINFISATYSIAKSELINKLLIKICKHQNFSCNLMRTIQYQNRIDKNSESWHKIHASIPCVLFEQCFDLKKLFRKSLSLFFAISCEKYLDDVIAELKQIKKSDNYPSSYLLFNSKKESVNYMSILWEITNEEIIEETLEIHKKFT